MRIQISRGEETLSEIELAEGEYIIGSSESAHLRLSSDLVAPEHARLKICTGGVEVEDLGSGRGTFLGEFALTGAQPVPNGSTFQIGDLALQIWDDETPSASTAPEMQEDGRYVIGEVIAAGAMGVIRSARELSTGREVAMKQMRDESSAGSDALAARFVQEAKITAHLEHPNVVPVHDVSPGAEGVRFYTMKMVRGISLEKVLDLLRQRADATLKKYPLEALLTIFQKVCDAVAFAHSKGIIHRDLKPANLMVGAYGEVLVMDWGLAKLVGEAALDLPATNPDAFAQDAGGVTLAGTVMGTPYYMAPEQAAGDVALVDARSDLYALGAILYELLTLQTPVAGRTTAEVLQQVRDGKIVLPLERAGATPLPHLPGGCIPASLAAVAMKALAYSPERRYQHVPDLQAEIRAYQSGFATRAEDAGAWRQFTLFLQRNRAVSTAIAAGLVLLGLVSAFYTVGVIRERDRTKSALTETEVQRKRADDALGRLHETAPDFITKARQFLADGKANDAIKHFGFSLDVAPENTDVRLERADLLLTNNRPAEAIPEYERALTERPSDERAKANLAKGRELLRVPAPPASGPVGAMAAGFAALFNGKDLTAFRGGNTFDPRKLAAMPQAERAAQITKWTTSMRAHWRVENGELVNDGKGDYATTEKEFGDFELVLEYKTVPRADSGIYLRGYPQVQIWDFTDPAKFDRSANKGSGGLWNNSPGTPGKDPLVKADKPFGDWNKLRILLTGDRVSVWLNDQLVVNHAALENYFDRSTPIAARGPIQFQTFNGEIRFRNVRIREV